MYTLQEIKPLVSIIICFIRHVINQYEYVFPDNAFWNGDKKANTHQVSWCKKLHPPGTLTREIS